jgi:hypothetical protein
LPVSPLSAFALMLLSYNGAEPCCTIKAIIRYRFGDEPDKKLILGKFSDWKLVYRTPGKIASVPIPFEFKNLELP